MSTKQFTIGQILSITTGRLCCEMGGVYEILNFITGDNLYTHVLPRAMRFAEPLLKEEHPELFITDEQDAELTQRIDEAKGIGGNIMGAVGIWLSTLGMPMTAEVQSHAAVWMSLNPLDELRGMVGEEKIVVVTK